MTFPKKKVYKLPLIYDKLHPTEKRAVREQYIKEQNGLCWWCGEDIHKEPPQEILHKKLNLKLFPPFFLKHPIHLQHDHTTGLTEGAVHAYCNGIMWEYYQR